MSEPTSSSQRQGGLRTELVRTVIVLAAFAVTLGGLHTILEGYEWWFLCVALCAAVLGTGVGVRAVLRARSTRGRSLLARIIAPAAGLCVAAAVVMLRFGAGTGFAGIIPTAETMKRFGTLVRDAGYSITWQNVPATADEPISFVLALGVVVLVIFAEIAAFSLRLPALVGLPLAVIFVIPGITPEGRTDGWFFAASAMVYLALLLVGRRWRTAPALAVAALAVVGGLILPGVLPSTDITVTSSGLGPSVSTGANPILHLGADLRDNQKRTALTYSTVSGMPEYLRLAEISDFSGENWGPDKPELNPQNRPVSFPLPPGLSQGITTTPEVTYIHVANLTSPWLPLPYAPSKVTGLHGSWQFLSDSFTVGSNVDLARGESYTVTSVQITPTPQQLLAAGRRVPQQLERYLSLPVDAPVIIADTAKSVTARESSNYEKAIALQEFLRNAPFQYSESAPEVDGYDGTGLDYVAAFLEQHKGYCIHFASAMAVMAREIGIPSRITVGFQPGTLQSDDDHGRRLFAVTTKDLHAWPELYFDSIGWVRFEPTPSRGTVPEYANLTTAGVPALAGPDSGGTQSLGRDLGSGAPMIDDGPTAGQWLSAPWLTRNGSAGWLILCGILAAIVVIMLIPAFLRRSRRWRRLAAVTSGRESVISLWWEIVESAEDAGILVGPTLTPRAAVARLQRVPGMPESARDALHRVGDSLEREGYGPPRVADAAEQITDVSLGRSGLVADAKVIMSCLASRAPSDERVRAFLLPPSLVARTKRAVARLV